MGEDEIVYFYLHTALLYDKICMEVKMSATVAIIVGLIGVAISVGLVYYFSRKGDKTVEYEYNGHTIKVKIQANFVYFFVDDELIDSNSALGPNHFNFTFHHTLGMDEIRIEITNY